MSAARAFRLTEIESWPECLEILIEGEIDLLATEQLEDSLERAVESDRLYLLLDLERCEAIDLDAVKLLVVAHERLSDRGQELLIFGATDQVRRAIEAVEAFDDRVLRAGGDSPPNPSQVSARPAVHLRLGRASHQ
jgi:anti-anti-sigma factor